jgi:hypothetical protein
MNTPPPSAAPRPNNWNDRPTATPRDSGAPLTDPNRPPSANGMSMASVGASAVAFRSPALEPATAAPRREVLNAMRALHEMPPFAREREIEQGRFSHFSPEERDMLRNAER